MDRSQVEEIVSRRLCDIETALPAKVTSVSDNGLLSVEVLIKKVTVDGIVDTENRIMESIRPFTIGNSSASVDIGIPVGAQVLLVGLSRHAREWLGTQSDDAVIPKSAHGNMLNDLVAVPLFRGDRESGKNARIYLGEDGDVEVVSKYGQSLKFNKDGSIDFNPKAGKKVKINGDLDVTGNVSSDGIVNDASYNLTELGNKYTVHVHPVPGVTPGTGSTTTSVPAA